MAFPQTQLSLIERLASGGSDADWQRFLRDYWGPICRFALRYGAKNLDEAEDVASDTFQSLWEQNLLVRWSMNRSAKLRTLLCCVVRNTLSHRNRVRAGRERHQEDVEEHVEQLNQTPDQHVDAFYGAWVEDILQQAVESVAADCCRKGQADYVRVLYGRLCQGMTIAKTAQALKIAPAAVDHYFRNARERLAGKLEELTRRQVEAYCPANEVEEEFGVEWNRLGQYLTAHGGLDAAVRQAYDLLDPIRVKKQQASGLAKATTRLTSIMHASS